MTVEEFVAAIVQTACNHGITFDKELADSEKLSPVEIRKRFPRLYGKCPLGCGYDGIYYASKAQYVYGDW